MTRLLLSGNAAAAWGARLAMVDFVPTFPMPHGAEIIDMIAGWTEQGMMAGRLVQQESDASVITAAAAAAISGVRVFAASSSQGLLHAMEMLYHVSGWRVPLVLVAVSRGISLPNTIEPDYNGVLAARDSGFLQIHCATCQEVLDSVLFAHRLAEDEDIRLPVLVNQDGFSLSFTREPVAIPNATAAKQFVGSYNSDTFTSRTSTPLSHAVATFGSGPYSYFRYELHLASQQALIIYDELANEFRDFFGRYYPAVDAYRSDDAEYMFVIGGSLANQAKEAVDRLRDSGWKIGLLRPRLVRPFPQQKFASLLQGKRAVAVIDQDISLGKGGILHTELVSALYGQSDVPPIIASFIGGLGGRRISEQEFFAMATVLHEAVACGDTPPPRMLFTEDEFREVKKLRTIAYVERESLD